MTQVTLLAADVLETLARDLLSAAGASGSEAEIVAEHLVTSSLLGHDSHGILDVDQVQPTIGRGLDRFTSQQGSPARQSAWTVDPGQSQDTAVQFCTLLLQLLLCCQAGQATGALRLAE